MSLSLLEFPIGSLWKRADIHRRLGGNRQRGISSAAGKPYILIFSGPQGKKYGYEDGWDEDGFFHLDPLPILWTVEGPSEGGSKACLV